MRSDGEPIAFMAVRIKALDIGVFADERGEFRLKVPEGRHTLTFEHVAWKNIDREVDVSHESGTALAVDLERDTQGIGVINIRLPETTSDSSATTISPD